MKPPMAAEHLHPRLSVTIGDLARECVMSHNISLNYGGVTPSMAVFGVIPRPFYQDDSSGITSLTGGLQTDVTPFEKALRIRQLALSTAQREPTGQELNSSTLASWFLESPGLISIERPRVTLDGAAQLNSSRSTRTRAPPSSVTKVGHTWFLYGTSDLTRPEFSWQSLEHRRPASLNCRSLPNNSRHTRQ